MANTYIQIGSTVTVGSGGAADITFSSIPATFTDLLIKVSARGSYSGGTIAFRLNPNGSTSNMTSKVLYGDGSAAASFSDTIAYGNIPASTSTSNTFGNLEFYLPNYASSNNKTISCDGVTENNATAALALFSASLWSDSTAISSIVLYPTVGTILQYSTATLYGIKST